MLLESGNIKRKFPENWYEVGDPNTGAVRVLEYADLGIDTFVLSGYPHLEEAYRVAELVFPRLPLQNLPTFSKPSFE